MVRILSLVSMFAAVSSISTQKSTDATKKASDTKVAKPERKSQHFSRLHRMVASTKKSMAMEIQGFATEGAKSSGAVDAQNTYSFPGTERAVGGQDGYVMEVIYENDDCSGTGGAYGSFWGLGQCYTDYNNDDDVEGYGDYSYLLACGQTSPYVYMWWGQHNCSGDPTYMKPLGVWMENDDWIPFEDDRFDKRQSVTKLNSCKKFSFIDSTSNDDVTLHYSFKVHCPRFDDLSFSLPVNTYNVLNYYDYHQDTTCSSKPQSGDFYRDGYCVHDSFCEGYGHQENCHNDRDIKSFVTVWDTSANLPTVKGPEVVAWREVNCWSSPTVEESYRHALATNCSAWLHGNVQHWSHVQGGLSPEPTSQPSTLTPTEKPTAIPTAIPTHPPTAIPTHKPSFRPTEVPSMPPTYASAGPWQYSHAALVATVVISVVGFFCLFGIAYLIVNAYRAATGYQNSEVELR